MKETRLRDIVLQRLLKDGLPKALSDSVEIRLTKVGLPMISSEITLNVHGKVWPLGNWEIDSQQEKVIKIVPLTDEQGGKVERELAEAMIPDIWLSRQLRNINEYTGTFLDGLGVITKKMGNLILSIKPTDYFYYVRRGLNYNYLLYAMKSIFETSMWWKDTSSQYFHPQAIRKFKVRFRNLELLKKEIGEKTHGTEQETISRLSRAIAAYKGTTAVSPDDVDKAFDFYEAILHEIYSRHEPSGKNVFLDPSRIKPQSIQVRIFEHWYPTEQPTVAHFMPNTKNVINRLLSYTTTLIALDKLYFAEL